MCEERGLCVRCVNERIQVYVRSFSASVSHKRAHAHVIHTYVRGGNVIQM